MELDELVKELVGLDNALVIDKSSLELHRKVLLLLDVYCGSGWQWHNLYVGEHLVRQVLDLLVVVVLDVVPWHLARLGVAALVLLVDIDVVVPVPAQM